MLRRHRSRSIRPRVGIRGVEQRGHGGGVEEAGEGW